ncbi:MAG: hypothetical protein K2W88_12205, partial [Pararheinheimera sp.]|nr:hypothetical protein [Rheinheimera sp.]
MNTHLSLLLGLCTLVQSAVATAEEAVSSQTTLEALWHTKVLRVPESVLWYQQHSEGKTDSLLFVSEIDGQGS